MVDPVIILTFYMSKLRLREWGHSSAQLVMVKLGLKFKSIELQSARSSFCLFSPLVQGTDVCMGERALNGHYATAMVQAWSPVWETPNPTLSAQRKSISKREASRIASSRMPCDHIFGGL